MPTPPRSIGVAIVALSLLTVSLAATGLASHTGGEPDEFEQEARFLPDAGGARLGFDVVVDSDRALAAAPGEGTGQVYVYEKGSNGWTQTAKLSPPDPATATVFGTSVDLDGDLAIVGDREESFSNSRPGVGSAYVFEAQSASDWDHVATLTPPTNADTSRGFGAATAIDEATGTALVGAPEDDSGGERAGQAYVFTADDNDAWTLEATLAAGSPAAGEEFGAAVALEPGVALVGAPGANAAYAFTGSGSSWSSAIELVASTGGVTFGESVDLDGTTGIVGDFVGATAYIFDPVTAGGTEDASIQGDDPLDERAADVALSGDMALIGGTGLPGKAFLFQQDDEGDWSQIDVLRSRDAVSHVGDFPRFGHAAGLDGENAIVGADGVDSLAGQRDGGAAFMYGPCHEDGPISSPLHDDIEPAAGPAGETIHNVNCDWVQELEDPTPPG